MDDSRLRLQYHTSSPQIEREMRDPHPHNERADRTDQIHTRFAMCRHAMRSSSQKYSQPAVHTNIGDGSGRRLGHSSTPSRRARLRHQLLANFRQHKTFRSDKPSLRPRTLKLPMNCPANRAPLACHCLTSQYTHRRRFPAPALLLRISRHLLLGEDSGCTLAATGTRHFHPGRHRQRQLFQHNIAICSPSSYEHSSRIIGQLPVSRNNNGHIDRLRITRS